MSATQIEVYDAIKSKLGEKETKILLDYMESGAQKEVNRGTSQLATKADLADVKSEMIKWMFIFWIGTVLTLVGSFIGIFKFAGIL